MFAIIIELIKRTGIVFVGTEEAVFSKIALSVFIQVGFGVLVRYLGVKNCRGGGVKCSGWRWRPSVKVNDVRPRRI
jgi:hypothetical protein